MNTMSVSDASVVLNSIVSQATGKAQITPTNTSEFVALAKLGLEKGYDPLATAISQILSRTIFSVRPYQRKFKGLFADSLRWGNHVRKLQVVDREFVPDEKFSLVDGQSIDMYKVRKPVVLQTNFYGETTFSDYITRYKDQLDVAFSGPEELASFFAMVTQNMSDRIEQAHEGMAREAVANFIGAKALADPNNVVYLLDVYDAETGLTSTTQSIKQPDKFAPFAKWLYSWIKTMSRLLSERTTKYHQNFTVDGSVKYIARHTPLDRQKLYLYAKEINDIDASVLSGVFNEEYMRIMDHELTSFWQALDTPMKIDLDAGYTDSTGAATHGSIELDNVFGVLFDEEAIGYTVVNESMVPTSMNASGLYVNFWYHFTDRYWNDLTENGIVMILDHAPEG